MKAILLFLISALLSISLSAQKQGQDLIDSLQRELPKLIDDTNKVNILYRLSSEYYSVDPTKGIEYGNDALELAEDINWKDGIASAYKCLGVNYYCVSDYTQALDYYLKSLNIFEEIGNKRGMASNLGNIGLIYSNQSDYTKALEYYSKALKINEEIDNKRSMAINQSNIGLIYSNKSDFNKSLEYLLQSLNTFEEIGNKRGMASSLVNIGMIYSEQSEYNKALDYYFKALKIFEEIGNKRGMVSNLSYIGLIYHNKSEYAKSLDYYLKALKLAEEIGNRSGIASNFENIGMLYLEQSEYEKALENYLKSIKIYEEIGDRSGIASNFGNIGILYSKQSEYEKALNYYLKALKIAEEIGATYIISNCYVGYGNALVRNDDIEKGIEYLDSALIKVKEIGDKRTEVYCYQYLSNGYRKLAEQEDSLRVLAKVNRISYNFNSRANYQKALKYALKAKELAKEIDLREALFEVYYTLSISYEELGNCSKALKFYKKYSVEKDSVFSVESKTKIANLEAKIENEKKDAEIKSLNDKKEKREIIIMASAGGIVLLLVLAYVLYRRYKFKEKAEQLLKEKNEIISITHKRITDSITYASGIQSAVLPFDSRIRKFLKDFFVLFIPKDIVSGDFYWIEKLEEKIIIVVGDCTGHGVPGAFMSMIGNELLNNIVIKQKILDPAVVLSEMHKDVRYALRQDETVSSSHDGMDVCICVIDNQKLTFAGAKRPLYYVQNNEFHEIKGDRKSIGGRQKEEERTFTNHEISLTTETMLYLTTDGYQDQHNTKQEKFGVKRFRDYLHTIADKPIEEQKEILEKELNEFSEGEKNRDDIAIFGIRISS